MCLHAGCAFFPEATALTSIWKSVQDSALHAVIGHASGKMPGWRLVQAWRHGHVGSEELLVAPAP